MKIERIDENTIRCILTHMDLHTRNVKLSELTYGSAKARELFHEMMQKASSEFGFEAEDIPLMVEAIPMPGDSIMLIITKIDDPEELDTRFSRFTPDRESENNPLSDFTSELLEGADGLMDLLSSPELKELADQALAQVLADTKVGNAPASTPADTRNADDPDRYVRIYQFDALDLVCAAAKGTDKDFSGSSVLYKNPVNGKFYLVIRKDDANELAFSRICNRLSEYAIRQKQDAAIEAHYAEHYELFVKKDALQVLANL